MHNNAQPGSTLINISDKKMIRFIILILSLTLTALSIGHTAVATSSPSNKNSTSRPAAGEEVCPSDIISYWKLDEETGTTFADSIQANHASCSAPGCPEFTSGQINGGRYFDGINDQVNVPDDESLHWENSDSFSIELWINTSQSCLGNRVFAGKHSFNASWWVGCGDEDGLGLPIFSIRDTTNTKLELWGTIPINDGQWHHLVAVRSSQTNESRLYVDGVENAAEVMFLGGDYDNTLPLRFGYHLNSYHTDGIIDEIALYSRRLLPSEIQNHYTQGLAGQGYCSIQEAPPIIVSTPLTNAVVAHPYSYDVQANGNPAPSFSLTTAPVGMTISPTTGLVEWLPASAGSFPVTVQATNSGGTDSQSFTINVTEANPPTIVSTPVTTGIVGVTYHYDVNADGAPPPTYTLMAGPGDMAINSTSGVIFWTPSAAGNYSATVQANNTAGYDSQTFTINVVPAEPPVFTSNPVTTAVINQPYTYDADASGVPAPTYSLTNSPAGMTIEADSGVIAWTPTATGSFVITARATNVAGFVNQTFTLHVYAPPAFTSTPVTTAVVNQPYNYDADATGVPAPTYSLVDPAAGMTINATSGAIAWAPTAAGNFAVTVRATNVAGSATQTFTIVVSALPTFTSTPPETAVVNQPYNYNATATGVPAPTYSLVDPPAGMTINATNGTITWTPTAAGNFAVTVRATNSAGATDQSFVIEVSSPQLYLPIVAKPTTP